MPKYDPEEMGEALVFDASLQPGRVLPLARGIRGTGVAMLLMLCGALGATPIQDSDAELRRHFQTAREAQDAGKLDVAEREYSAALRLQPELAQVQASLGLVYYLQARYEDSARMLGKAVAHDVSLRGVNLFLGIDYVKLSQPKRAVPLLERAVAQEPSNREAATWLGTALWDAGREPEAIRQLRKVAHAFPTDPDASFMLGQAYRNESVRETASLVASIGAPLYHLIFGDIYTQQKDWPKATGHFQRAIQQDPLRTGAHYGLGEAYLRQGKWDEARQEFQRELSVAPDFSAAEARLAQIAIVHGERGEGLRLLNDALRTTPEAVAFALGLPVLPGSGIIEPVDATTRERYVQALPALRAAAAGAARSLALAAVYLRLGFDQDAQREWTVFLVAVPPRTAIANSYERARAEFHRHDFEAAEADLDAALAANPEDRQARYLLARTHQFLSLVVLNRMLDNAPDSFRAHQLLAQTYDQREENDKALVEYRTVERTNPALSGLHFAIGHILWKLDQPGEAIPELEQELRLNPGHAEANAEIGTILVSQHFADRAVPYLEKALHLRPDLAAAHLELGKALYQHKNFARAEQELKRALPWDPEGNVHYLLGVVNHNLGRAEESQAEFAESRRIKAERLAGVKIGAARESQP
jgi:tetratricopeptide (TPR) repeat protein